jgi:hypothetical protein
MRAGSTLLTQLIATSDEVLGYGELHLAYRRKRDLQALNGKTAWVGRQWRPTEAVAIDKVLHDYLLLPEHLRRISSEIEVIFLVRRARDTLRSLTASFAKSEREAYDYYTSRLDTIRRYLEVLEPGQPCLALTYEDIVGNTSNALSAIGDQLRLERPLSAEYQPIDRGGDPSPNLMSGRILSQSDKLVRHEARIDEALAAEAEAVFERTWQALSARCTTVTCT